MSGFLLTELPLWQDLLFIVYLSWHVALIFNVSSPLRDVLFAEVLKNPLVGGYIARVTSLTALSPFEE